MATLFTHAGLILFLVAAAVTSRLGDEQGLVVPEGESLTVQPIGTPGLLLVKNLDFEAPGFETGRPTDFTTDLAVYQDGQEIARKTIRVNDPLSVGGYTFHQNGFGPAPHLVRPRRGGRAAVGRAGADDRCRRRAAVRDRWRCPGRDIGLQLLLDRAADGTRHRARRSRTGSSATDADGDADRRELSRRSTCGAATTRVSRRPRPLDRARGLRRVHAAHRQARPGPGHRLARVRAA